MAAEGSNERIIVDQDGVQDGSSKFKNLLHKHVPITTWLPHYRFSTLLYDLLAGFSVGLTEIPQAIAFATIAGLPTEYGLYCGIFDGFIYAILGTCKDVNIGPTSIMSLMVQQHVTQMGFDMAVIITFWGGCIIFLLGCFKLGFVVRFFSYPIIAGFICAGSLQIASTQVKPLLGIPGKANAFLEAWISIFGNLTKAKLWDAILGVVSLVVLVTLREIRRYGTLQKRSDWSLGRNIFGIFIYMLSLARNALVVIIGATIAYSLRDENPFAITGEVHGGFPPFGPPPFSFTYNGTSYDFQDIMTNYGAGLAFIPLVAILEAISIAKAFKKDKTLDASQEMIALGMCNIIGSLVRSMPVTGSFTRTAVNNASGVKTPIAGVFTSLMVILSVAFLTSSFYYIPKATLGAVIICAMFYLFDFDAFRKLRHNKMDFYPFLITLLTCLFISLEYGILIGIGVNLVFMLLYPLATPDIVTEIHHEPVGGGYATVTLKDTSLFYPAAEYLREKILTHAHSGLIVVNGRAVTTIDVTVAKSVSMITNELKNRRCHLVLLNFHCDVMEMCVRNDPTLADSFKWGEIDDILNATQTNDDQMPTLSIQAEF